MPRLAMWITKISLKYWFWAHNETEVEDLVGKLLGTKPLDTDLDKDVMDA